MSEADRPSDGLWAQYQSILGFIAAHWSASWASFNAMLAVNTFLLGGGGVIAATRGVAGRDWLVLVVAIVGLLTCISWFLIIRRAIGYLDFYFACARDIERAAVEDSAFRFVCKGHEFSLGKLVSLSTEEKLQRMPWPRRVKVRWCMWLIISVFFVGYSYLLVTALGMPDYFGILTSSTASEASAEGTLAE